MRSDATTFKLLAHAGCAAPGAIIIGLCAARLARHFDEVGVTLAVVFALCLLADLVWIRREVHLLGMGELAREPAAQFLWSCVFLSLISLGLGMAVGSLLWFEGDFVRRFSLGFWTLMAISASYPLFRDAKRLADASRWSGARQA